MLRPTRSQRRTKERGAATVELAIVAIFMALLVMGVIDIGRLIFTGLAVEDAAQEGAAFAAFTQAATVPLVIDRVVNSVDSPVLNPAQVTVVCNSDPRPKQDGAHVTVVVQNTVTLITPIISPMLGGSVTIVKEAYSDRYFPCSALPAT